MHVISKNEIPSRNARNLQKSFKARRTVKNKRREEELRATGRLITCVDAWTRKAAISFALSFCPSTRNSSASTGSIFIKFHI